MKKASKVVLAILFVSGSVPKVMADPFFNDQNGFHDRRDDFMRSLGEAGQQMRNDYDSAAISSAQRAMADQQNIQDGTQATAQQSFQQSQMQASASGGLYNGNSNLGNNGIGGGWGINNGWSIGLPPGYLNPYAVGSNQGNYYGSPAAAGSNSATNVSSTAGASLFPSVGGPNSTAASNNSTSNSLTNKPSYDPFASFGKSTNQSTFKRYKIVPVDSSSSSSSTTK